jgi:hypothetical protein
MAVALNPIKTFWRRAAVTCVLYTGGGSFELRLIEADRVLRAEACRDSGDAYTKSQLWARDQRPTPFSRPASDRR